MTRYLLAELGDGDGLEKAVFDAAEAMESDALSSAGNILMVHSGRTYGFAYTKDVFAWRVTGLRVLDQDVMYVLQGLYPKGWRDDKAQRYLPLPEDTWIDVMSTKIWKDPAVRAAALAEFRTPDPEGEHHPSMCKQWRMVCRINTEVVLDE